MLLVTLHPFYEQHQESKQQAKFTVYGMGIEELIRKHTFQIAPSLRYAFGAEDNPANDGKEERQGHLTKLLDVWQIAFVGYHVFVFRIDAEDIIDGKQCCMVQSLADERPVGSVP